MENIIVQKYSTPIKHRGFDWMAHFGAVDDFRALYGFGATEQEAIDDLLAQTDATPHPETSVSS